MSFEVAGGLFVVYQFRDGWLRAADGARRTLAHGDGAELHRLGIEGQQAVGEQRACVCEIRLTRYSAGLQQVTWWIKKERQPNFSDCRPKSG